MPITLEGRILGIGFGSGHRVVVGHWDRSPIGPFADVMWATPDGERILFADSEDSAAFISAVYQFDRVAVGPVRIDTYGRASTVTLADRALVVQVARARPVMGPRPLAVTRYVEGPLAHRLLGVQTYGVSPTGVHEWYQARWWAPLRSGFGQLGDRDLGPMTDLHPPCRFGFSEPPRRPSLTGVRPALHDSTGRLDALLAGIAAAD